MRGGRARGRSRLRRVLAMAGAMLMVALGLVLPAGTAHAAGGFTISDARLTAPTGIAADPAHDRYWVVNRDNQGGRVFAVSASGTVDGIKTWGASVRSLEAVAVYDNKLWVADIGDAAGTRDFVTVYWFANFAPGDSSPQFRSYDFTYADGARDAKAMLVTPSGRFYFITSGDHPGIYAAPEQLQVQGTNELTRVADAPAGVTDAVALDAGRWALRTATTVLVVDAATFRTTATAKLADPGDGLGLPLSGSGLLAVSSGTATTTVADVPVPTATQPASPTPSQTASPSPSASPSAESGENIPASDAASGSRTVTFLAIGIAALVALAAGAAVFLLPRTRIGRARAAAPAATDGVRLEQQVVRTPATPASPVEPAHAAEPASYPGRGVVSPSSPEPYAPRRARPPGDISDEDEDEDDSETTLVRDTRGLPSADEPSGALPRRSLGYDQDLWGDDWYRSKTVQSADEPER